MRRRRSVGAVAVLVGAGLAWVAASSGDDGHERSEEVYRFALGRMGLHAPVAFRVYDSRDMPRCVLGRIERPVVSSTMTLPSVQEAIEPALEAQRHADALTTAALQHGYEVVREGDDVIAALDESTVIHLRNHAQSLHVMVGPCAIDVPDGSVRRHRDALKDPGWLG